MSPLMIFYYVVTAIVAAVQVLVLLDGIPLNDPLTGEVDLNLIPVSIIESVSIKKGGNSSESGSGSIGGTVAISSRQEFLDEIKMTGFQILDSTVKLREDKRDQDELLVTATKSL